MAKKIIYKFDKFFFIYYIYYLNKGGFNEKDLSHCIKLDFDDGIF